RVPLPSAGVGTALTRNALSLLAIERGGDPFRADSLAEDYEVGMLLDAFGLSARFVDAVDGDGTRIVSRGEFPARVEAAARQKARWVVGIALAGWDHVAWPAARPDDGPRG
ncbi:MAG TPA: glycosyltransferase family 2 protein, partial [Sphingopyxis terrae]|nr:glycosyltransferase family 2 protein [Sphingopyxis terrae]